MADKITAVATNVSAGVSTATGIALMVGWLKENYWGIAALCLIGTFLATLLFGALNYRLKVKRLEMDRKNGYIRRKDDGGLS